MGMRDMFRGGRDEGRERWRDEGRFGREQAERQDWPRPGSERDFDAPGGAYGQPSWSGRDQDYGGGEGYSGQYRQDNPRESSGREFGGRNYPGGFYTGEPGQSGNQRGGQQFGGQYARRSGGQYGQYGQSTQYGMGSSFGGMSSQMGGQSYEGPHRGQGPRGYQRSDDRIREDACECLTDDPSIDASNLEVTVKNCEVTLTGTVNSREDKRRAVDLVENISGVKDVHNNLRISTADQSTATQSSQATQIPRH